MPSPNALNMLLPWYVNGTLDAASRRAVDSALAQSSSLRSEVAWLRIVRSQIHEQAHTDVNARPKSAGLDTLMALIRAEQSGKVSPLPARLGRCVKAVRSLPLSVGIAAAVVLTQAVIIGTLLDPPAHDTLRTLSGGVAASGQLLQITFKPQATETQIRALLARVQGEIVAGPGALGVYAVRVPEHQGTAALEKLRSDSTAVDTVVLLPGR